MATKQEIFTRVKEHLLKQQEPAIDSFGECLYYNPKNGDKCAVGCLIKRKYYTPEIESEPAACPEVIEALTKSLGSKLSKTTIRMLGTLQEFHDNRLKGILIEDDTLEEEHFDYIREQYNVK